ncbi:hypothetical protein [Streptomyces sp. NPDC059970]|uniref:hypothetical protein n=1 Tax=Streptomyces sp. NPDC059970 TaxID=3347019 RepID=UPI00367867CD
MSDHAAMILLGFALSIFAAVLVAAGAGYHARRGECSYPAAVTRAATAFAATLTLIAVVAAALVALNG